MTTGAKPYNEREAIEALQLLVAQLIDK